MDLLFTPAPTPRLLGLPVDRVRWRRRSHTAKSKRTETNWTRTRWNFVLLKAQLFCSSSSLFIEGKYACNSYLKMREPESFSHRGLVHVHPHAARRGSPPHIMEAWERIPPRPLHAHAVHRRPDSCRTQINTCLCT